MRILQVDNDVAFAKAVARSAHADGYVIDHMRTLTEARDALQVANYHAILIDRMLPDGDGLNLIREHRRTGNTTPVLIVTSQLNSLNDRVEGLNEGADDYILKPVPLGELLARLRAVLRRPAIGLDSLLRAGNIMFDPAIREVTVAQRVLRMPRRETCILEMLIRRAGRTVTKGVLEDGLYSFDDEVSSNAIEVGVYRLRGLLSGAGATARVRTVRGVGYVLECCDEDQAVKNSTAAILAAWVAMALSRKGGGTISTLPAALANRNLELIPEAGMAVFAAALALSLAPERYDERSQ